ncbi:MAG: response regulator transcription factor [Kiritimatiellae bacterium]|nr:response regulator transcription factor [Kiritimatiellia bacterium]
MAEILFAEDDPDVRRWVCVALESEGHSVRVAADGDEALREIAAKRPDLIMLDVTMPGVSGFEVCKAVRDRDAAVPILMLTARGGEADKLTGFRMGADDYVTKPFSMKELFARVAALLRRAKPASSETRPGVCESFAVGAARIDGARMAVLLPNGEEHPLAAREHELLSLLNRRAGEVLRRDFLLDEIWGVTFYGNTRTLDQHIALLRKKLGPEASRLETVRNVGYRLRAGEEAES